MPSILEKLQLNPKKLFLIDGLGAMLSAFLLGVVLVRLESIFGIPRQTLYLLAALPCLFALYDCYGYLGKAENREKLLKGIAVLNLLYCSLSLGLACYHHQVLTLFGWTYLLLEMLLVASLAMLELKIACNHAA